MKKVGLAISLIMMASSVAAQEGNPEVKAAIQDVYDSGLIEKYDKNAVLTPAEQHLLNTKIEAIKKQIVEHGEIRPFIEDLYQSNTKNAFDDYVRNMFGFSAEQWRDLREKEIEIQKARNEPIENVKINIREENLDNGSVKPIEINVVKGYATAIVFVDASGKPWPIQGDITGDNNSYASSVSLPHVAVIDNVREFSESNALINLAEMDIPIVLRLKSNREVSDSRVIIHLPELGPNAEDEVEIKSVHTEVTHEMKELLNTGQLQNSQEFYFDEIPGSIFLKEGWMYIRTKDELMIPSPKETGLSPTGYRVYKIPPANTFLFRNTNGEKLRTTLGGARDVSIKHKTSLFER